MPTQKERCQEGPDRGREVGKKAGWRGVLESALKSPTSLPERKSKCKKLGGGWKEEGLGWYLSPSSKTEIARRRMKDTCLRLLPNPR